MGRLIPAGTGLAEYNRMEVKVAAGAAPDELEKVELGDAALPAAGD
jgi:hypothetical protein